MESYLSKKRRVNQSKKTKSKPKIKEIEDVEEFKEEEKKYFVRKNILHKILDFISGEKQEIEEEELQEIEQEEIEELEEELEELEEKPRLTIVERIKRWLYIQDEMPLDEEEKSLVDEEIKTALKIQNKWLSQLSNKKIKEFKESEDYDKYKEILDKYKLIKK